MIDASNASQLQQILALCFACPTHGSPWLILAKGAGNRRKIHGCVRDQAALKCPLIVSLEPLRDLELECPLIFDVERLRDLELMLEMWAEECLVLTQEEICRLNIFGVQLRGRAVSHRAVHDSLFWRRD